MLCLTKLPNGKFVAELVDTSNTVNPNCLRGYANDEAGAYKALLEELDRVLDGTPSKLLVKPRGP